MYEKQMIMTRGFKNVRDGDDVVGFQFNLRITYYRGIFLTLITGLDVSVDGEAFSRDQIRFAVGGREFTFSEMAKEETTRWPFGEPATVTVLKKGGLTPGQHEIAVRQAIKPAYMPNEGFVAHARKKITLVQ
ncbi:MAG TPA: DUF6379 domain-containing protein [Terriglobales bacterium]